MDRVALLQQQLTQAHLEGDRELELLLLNDLGDNFVESKDFSNALASYKQALDIARSIGHRQNEASILGKLGNMYTSSAQDKEAISMYEQALSIATELQDPKLTRNVLNSLGSAWKDTGEISRAIELYEQALTLARQVGDSKAERAVLSNLGNAYASQRQSDRAIDFYEQALAVARQVGDAWAEGITLGNLGNVYASQGQVRRAIDFYEQALALIRHNEATQPEPIHAAIIYRNRGNAYIALEEFQRAIVDYDRAIALDPGDAIAYASKADALAQLKRYQDALASYDRAIALAPDDAATYASKGDALVQMGRYAEALFSYNRAIALDPDNAAAYAGRGDSLTNIGQYEEALASYDQAIHLSHDDIYHYQKQQLLAKMQGEAAPGSSTLVATRTNSASPSAIRRGDVVDGVIVRINQDEILVDIGLTSEGVLSTRELPASGDWSFDNLHLRDKVLVYVIQPETPDGPALLSLKRAMAERQWRVAEEQYRNNELLKAKVIDYNKGGLIVDVAGIRGYVPISQILSLTHEDVAATGESQETPARLAAMNGKELQLKIIEVNRARNRLILSERLANQEWRQRRRDELLNELKAGEVRRGVVSNLANFGAFIDLGGSDGLVHISQLAWSRVNHPSEVLKVGQEVEVQVLSVDKEKKKIALSIKRADVDPWTTVEQRYTAGQVITGVIARVTPFGAFARIEDGIEGLIHSSELPPGMDPEKSLHEGQELQLRILRIDAERRRIGLSLRQAEEIDAKGSTPERPSSEIGGSASPQEGRGERRERSAPENPLLGNISLGNDGETTTMAEEFRSAARQRAKEEREAPEE
jgi:small subunit ribosomal protein S1